MLRDFFLQTQVLRPCLEHKLSRTELELPSQGGCPCPAVAFQGPPQRLPVMLASGPGVGVLRRVERVEAS